MVSMNMGRTIMTWSNKIMVICMGHLWNSNISGVQKRRKSFNNQKLHCCIVNVMQIKLIHIILFTMTTLQVAILDIDICGPSIPRLMGLEGEQVHQSGSGWSPVVSLIFSSLLGLGEAWVVIHTMYSTSRSLLHALF